MRPAGVRRQDMECRVEGGVADSTKDRQSGCPRRRQALRISFGYALISSLWLLLIDLAFAYLSSGALYFTPLTLAKGGAFVLATSWVLYLLLRNEGEDLRRLCAGQRQEVSALNQFRESVIDNASIWINVLDPLARITVWNKAAAQISGYSREEVLGNPAIWEWLYPDPAYRAAITTKVNEIMSQGAEVEGFESCIRAKDGTEKIISWNSRRFFDERGQLVGSISIGLDVTARNLTERALIERERQLATLMANLPGMAYRCLLDRSWTMRFVSSGCFALTGYHPEALVENSQLSFSDVIHPADRERVWQESQQAVQAHRPFALEYRILRQSGEEVWVWEQGRRVFIDDQPYLEGIVIDITQRKLMEQELALLATRDPLTGLYNRRELMRQLEEALARAQRYHHPCCLLLLDVDHFKQVNDRCGHLVGDEVLRRLGELLQGAVRGIDYAARYGGEELVVLLPESDSDDGVVMAERLRRLVELERWGMARSLGPITVSIGVAAFPQHGHTPETLFQAVDQALYAAKRGGRNQICLAH